MIVRSFILLLLCRVGLSEISTITGSTTTTTASDFFDGYVSKNIPVVLQRQLPEMLPPGFELISAGLARSGVAAISVVSVDGETETTLMDFFRKPTNSFEIPIHRNLKTRVQFPPLLRCNPLLSDLLFETAHTFADFDSAEHGGRSEEVSCGL